MLAMLEKSLSAEIGADCTRNLSRHRESRGGSAFMACRMTITLHVSVIQAVVTRQHTCHVEVLTRLNATSIWADAVPVPSVRRKN